MAHVRILTRLCLFYFNKCARHAASRSEPVSTANRRITTLSGADLADGLQPHLDSEYPGSRIRANCGDDLLSKRAQYLPHLYTSVYQVFKVSRFGFASKDIRFVNFGFAAGCEVALPRVSNQIIPGLCPWSGLSPTDLLGQRPHQGHSPKNKKGIPRRGKATASHPAAKPNHQRRTFRAKPKVSRFQGFEA